MSAGAPWSVKGIDAKAREVAKDLARRSGMTLGEWLNQMILEGRDVGVMIRDEDARKSRSRPAPRVDYDEDEDDAYELEAPVSRRPAAHAPVWADRPRAPYSTGARPLSSRDLRRRSIFEDQPRETRDSEDLTRVARALESLGSRIETSESRSAGAVRSVSAAVESLLGRLERSEAAHAETRETLEDRLAEQSQATFDRLSRTEADSGLFAERLDQAERLIDAQAERLEGLSGHVREERERFAKLEAQVKEGPVAETVRSLEGAVGKLANQIYEGEARSRDSLKDVREDMLGLSHRLAQMEMRDPERTAQGLIDKVVAQLSQRLETAEAQTSGALRTLEHAFTQLESRMSRAEERGDVTDPEAVRSLKSLAGDLSRQVADSRSEWRQALEDNRQQTLEQAVQAVESRIGAAEKRSASAIEKMGHDVLRIADNLNRRMQGVEASGAAGVARLGRDMQRLSEDVDARIARSDSGHAQALERLGGEIARISERLSAKLNDSERRTAEVLASVGEQVGQQRDHMREDLAERIRQSEERTARLLEETRARIDEKLARVQTESLLSEAARAPKADASDDGLPNPFEDAGSGPAPEAWTPETAVSPETPASPPSAPAPADDSFDLTGRLLGAGFGGDAEPEFDPFAPEGLDDALEPAPAPDDDDDSDPFAEIDAARKTAPASSQARPRAEAAPRPAQDVLDAPFEAPFEASGLVDDLEPEPSVSMSTRDALAAARAAVRASLEGQSERGNLLGGLKAGASRRQAPPKEKPGKDKAADKGGATLMNAMKASSLAVALVGVGTVGFLAFKNATPQGAKPGQPLAANVQVTDAGDDARDDAQNQQALKTRYDLAVKALDARAPGAVDALKQVANQGYAPAQFRLSLLYNGQDRLIPADKAQARLWTQRAAEGGVPKAMYNLGAMYYEGEGGSQDHSLAAMWFRKAAERGVKDSQYNLGVLYERGDGVPLNPSEAYKWLRIAGNSGDKVAAQEADDLAAQLTDEQRQRAEAAVTGFTPITDGAPPASEG
jgi:localization factor PodJL